MIPAKGATIPQVSDDVPFGFVGGPAALIQAAEGTNLKIIGSFLRSRVNRPLVVRPEIKSPHDLRGKRIGVRSIGAGVWIHAMIALEHLGLDPSKDDIKSIAIGGPVQIVNALEKGTIDAAVLLPPLAAAMRSRGYNILLEKYPANIFAFESGLVVQSAFLDSNKVVAERMLGALIEASVFLRKPKNKEAALKSIAIAMKRPSSASAEPFYRGLLAINEKPYPSVETFKTMQKFMAIENSKLKKVNIDGMVDGQLVKKIEDRGEIEKYRSQ